MRLRIDDDVQKEIHNHYDFFPHAVSGAFAMCLPIPGLSPRSLHKVKKEKTKPPTPTLPPHSLSHGLFIALILCSGQPASGLPLDILQAEWWVPGSTSRLDSAKFSGKPFFKEILSPSQSTCRLWILRATKDSNIL